MEEKANNPRFVSRNIAIGGKEYASFLSKTKERYRYTQIKAAVKVNTSLLEFYWDLGRDISKLSALSKWGSAFFECLSLDLKNEFPNQGGFSVTNLKYVKRWYDFYYQSDIIRHQVGDELEMPSDFGLIPWRHHIAILTHCKSVEEAIFYIDKTIQYSWSRSQLEFELSSNLYKRTSNAITNFSTTLPKPHSGLASAILKSPYEFGFITAKIVSERQLEDALATNITRFLLELGQGFAYVGRQVELQMPGGQTFIPDMIFYHTRLKCYIVVELKTVPFIPEFAGKLNFYVSALDELMKQPDDNPSIGLLICKSKDDTVVEWSFRGVQSPLGVAEYKLGQSHEKSYLPSESEIQKVVDTYIDNNDTFSGNGDARG